MKKTTTGFTIVELLIVIVVIAILAVVSVAAYMGIQQRARDSQRSHDIAMIQKALEMYHVDNGGYPACTSEPYVPGAARNHCATDSSGFAGALSKYIEKIPVDPLGGDDYHYRYMYGSRKTSNNTYSASFDDNYVLFVAYESKGGPYVTQLSPTSKRNFIAGSSN